MDGIDWRFWFVFVAIWVVVPAVVVSTSAFFNQNTIDLDNSQSWENITTYAYADEAALDAISFFDGTLRDQLADINAKVVAGVSTFTVSIPFIGNVIANQIEDAVLDAYNVTVYDDVPTTFTWWQMNSIIITDRFLGWAISPVSNYYWDFRYSLNLLESEIDMPSFVTGLMLALFWSLPLLLAFLLLMRLIEVIGGLSPFG